MFWDTAFDWASPVCYNTIYRAFFFFISLVSVCFNFVDFFLCSFVCCCFKFRFFRSVQLQIVNACVFKEEIQNTAHICRRFFFPLLGSQSGNSKPSVHFFIGLFSFDLDKCSKLQVSDNHTTGRKILSPKKRRVVTKLNSSNKRIQYKVNDSNYNQQNGTENSAP